MKVSLLTVIVIGILPGDVLAQQPNYARPAGQTARLQQVRQVSPAQVQQPCCGVEPEYRFNVAISITATGYQHGQKRENSVVTYYINPSKGWVATASSCEQQVAKAGGCAGLDIYDMAGGTMLVVNMRQKSGVSMSMPNVAATTAQRRRDLNLPPPGENGCHCEQTGKKKKIQGFLAEQYSCDNPSRKTRFEMWVTRELGTDLAVPGAHTELGGFMYRAARFKAVPLEGYYYENGDLKSSLTLTGVNRAAQLSVNTTEYELNKGRN